MIQMQMQEVYKDNKLSKPEKDMKMKEFEPKAEVSIRHTHTHTLLASLF